MVWLRFAKPMGRTRSCWGRNAPCLGGKHRGDTFCGAGGTAPPKPDSKAMGSQSDCQFIVKRGGFSAEGLATSRTRRPQSLTSRQSTFLEFSILVREATNPMEVVSREGGGSEQNLLLCPTNPWTTSLTTVIRMEET